MKSKLQKVIVGVVILSIVVLITVLLYASSVVEEKSIEQNEPTEQQVQPLVITTTPRNSIGTLTIRDENGGIHYQYQGEINVVSSGWDGDDVEINIDLYSTGCSCFDEEGNLIED